MQAMWILYGPDTFLLLFLQKVLTYAYYLKDI